QIARAADMRYFGQAWEVRVEVPSGELDRAAADVAVGRFHPAHQRTYGYSYADQPEQRIEWVNVRVPGVSRLPRPAIKPRSRTQAGDIQRALSGKRGVCFDSGMVETGVFARERLQPGDCIDGPAIVEEFGSTTVVFPGLCASVDEYANLIL